MKLALYSLEGVQYEGEATSLNIRTTSGEITVLDHHRPLITILTAGMGTITTDTGEKISIPIRSGFLEVDADNTLTALID